MLDEWHLNMNQIKNVTAFLQASGKVALYERMKQGSDRLPRTVGETAGAADTSPFDQMSTDLFTLRRSSTPERYAQRRAEFEMIYFETNDPRELPEWFRGLYVYKKEMIAECFNKTRCGLRFLFQGSGYTEAVNSLFRNVVMQRGVPMSRVPAELSRVTERYVRERGDQRDSVSRVLFARIEATGAFARGAQLDRFMHTFTSFAIKLWYDRSMIPSREWRVAGFMLMPVLVQAPDGAPQGPSNCRSVDFVVKQTSAARTAEYTVSVWPVTIRGITLLSAVCQCRFMCSAGLPCVHATRVSLLYDELCGNNPTIPQFLQTPLKLELNSMMHAHWMRDPSIWKETVVETRYSTTIAEPLEQTNPFGEEHLPIPDQIERVERERAVAWSNGRALYDQCHRKARAHGIDAAEALQGLMRNVLAQLSRNTLPGSNVDEENPLPVALRTEFGPAISSEGSN